MTLRERREALVCPVCGHTTIKTKTSRSGKKIWRAKCKNCYATTHYCVTEDECITAWENNDLVRKEIVA